MGNEKRQQKPRRPPQRTRLHPPGQYRSKINENTQIKHSLDKTKRNQAKRRKTRQPASILLNLNLHYIKLKSEKI